jgi:hypothetical protein
MSEVIPETTPTPPPPQHGKDFLLLLKRLFYDDRKFIREPVNYVLNGGRQLKANGWTLLIFCCAIAVALFIAAEHVGYLSGQCPFVSQIPQYVSSGVLCYHPRSVPRMTSDNTHIPIKVSQSSPTLMAVCIM